MNINPNLKNPLALFALCFLVVESIITALLIYRVQSIELCPWIIAMLFIFIVAFPVIIFVGFYILLFKKHEALFSPIENAFAQRILNMTRNEKQERQKEKNLLYGVIPTSPGDVQPVSNGKTKTVSIEDAILNVYISKYASFLRKDVKVPTKDGGSHFFDAYAYWNGCNYIVEVKRLSKWNSSSLQGVETFIANAKSCFYPIHMTMILQTESISSKEKIVKEIHEVDAAVNVIFAYEEDGDIKFSNIY